MSDHYDISPDNALLGVGSLVPEADDVEAVTEALAQKWREMAEAQVTGTPEEHCRTLAQHLEDNGFSLKKQE